MVAVSDVLGRPNGGGMPHGRPLETPENAAPARVRGRARIPVTIRSGKVWSWVALLWADVRSAWWAPESLPTVQRAWADRIPNRERVPGNSNPLYRAWVIYNHTVGLLVPLAATAAVGCLTPAVWVARHPARLLLALLLTIPVVVLAAT